MLRSPRAAFSLTELLVVVGLIAVLAVLIAPASGTLRARAKAAQCSGHLRSIGSALNLYIAEGNSLSPRKRPGNLYSFLGGSVPGEDTWSALLYKGGYLLNKQVYRCPAVRSTTAYEVGNWYYEVYGMNMITQPGISIGENPVIGNYSGGVYHLPVVRVERPSRLIIMADSRTSALSAEGNEVQRFRLLQGSAGAPADGISLRHGNRANVLFLDGHIERMSGEDLKALRQSPYAYVPYYDKDGTYHP